MIVDDLIDRVYDLTCATFPDWELGASTPFVANQAVAYHFYNFVLWFHTPWLNTLLVA